MGTVRERLESCAGQVYLFCSSRYSRSSFLDFIAYWISTLIERTENAQPFRKFVQMMPLTRRKVSFFEVSIIFEETHTTGLFFVLTKPYISLASAVTFLSERISLPQRVAEAFKRAYYFKDFRLCP